MPLFVPRIRNACMVKLTSAITGIPDSSALVVSWTAEQYDDAGWHDNSTNPSRLTVPAGVDRVRVGANVAFSNVDNALPVFAVIGINGVTSAPERAAATSYRVPDSTQLPRLSISSGQINVVAGQYFELFTIATGDAGYDISSTGTNFWIESV